MLDGPVPMNYRLLLAPTATGIVSVLCDFFRRLLYMSCLALLRTLKNIYQFPVGQTLVSAGPTPLRLGHGAETRGPKRSRNSRY